VTARCNDGCGSVVIQDGSGNATAYSQFGVAGVRVESRKHWTAVYLAKTQLAVGSGCHGDGLLAWAVERLSIPRLPRVPIEHLIRVDAIHRHALVAVESVRGDVDLSVASLVPTHLGRCCGGIADRRRLERLTCGGVRNL
jgi:hypothetical protein